MEIINNWLKDRKEKSDIGQLCEEISFLIREKVQMGYVLRCSEPYRILIVDDVRFCEDSARFSISVNMPALWGPLLDTYKFDNSHGEWRIRWRVKDGSKIEYPGIESCEYEEIPEKKREKCLPDLLRMIKNSTPSKYA